jgi:hypothetical protein
MRMMTKQYELMQKSMDVKFQQVLHHNQSLEQKVLKMESKF